MWQSSDARQRDLVVTLFSAYSGNRQSLVRRVAYSGYDVAQRCQTSYSHEEVKNRYVWGMLPTILCVTFSAWPLSFVSYMFCGLYYGAVGIYTVESIQERSWLDWHTYWRNICVDGLRKANRKLSVVCVWPSFTQAPPNTRLGSLLSGLSLYGKNTGCLRRECWI